MVRAGYIPRNQEVQASIYHVIRETRETLAHGGRDTGEMREWVEFRGCRYPVLVEEGRVAPVGWQGRGGIVGPGQVPW